MHQKHSMIFFPFFPFFLFFSFWPDMAASFCNGEILEWACPKSKNFIKNYPVRDTVSRAERNHLDHWDNIIIYLNKTDLSPFPFPFPFLFALFFIFRNAVLDAFCFKYLKQTKFIHTHIRQHLAFHFLWTEYCQDASGVSL